MYLSKTDFLEYLQCPKCLWLKKKKPELYTVKTPTEFEINKVREDREVEVLARQLFSKGILLSGSQGESSKETKELIASKTSPLFQAAFISGRNLIVNVDILTYNKKAGCWDIYEVKSSTKIKNGGAQNSIKETAFKKLVLQETGIPVGNTFIVHLNKEYKKKGELDVKKLFVITDVSEEIHKACDAIESEINEVLLLLAKKDMDLRASCACIYVTRGNHYPSFSVFNPYVPDYSVHDIPRIRPKKIRSLVDSGAMRIEDISDNVQLTDNQRVQVDLVKSQKAHIDKERIRQSLHSLEYPLYFLDYETSVAAIPMVEGSSPYQHMPFQVSIHKLDGDGNMNHFEYLAEKTDDVPLKLIAFMKRCISAKGSVVSWYAPFENTRNKEMAEMYPKHSHFLLGLNRRTFDLEQIFKKSFLHPGFKGSTSIKNVLPVLLPKFSYKTLDIQNGVEAMESWRKMIFDGISDIEREKIKKGLLEYCAMDTLAMVEIFKYINAL